MTRKPFAVALASLIVVLFSSTGHSAADVLTLPSFNLDGEKTASLANVASPTSWTDLVSGNINVTLGSATTRSAEGGGSIAVSAGPQNGSTSGGYLSPVAVGTPSNPSGDMTLMAWIKPTSWNPTWNIFASRWFNGFAGGGTAAETDYHFSIKINGSAHNLNLYTTSKTDIFGSYDFALNKWYLVGFTLTAGGNLQFYVNGQKDGAVVTGANHTASATNYLFVGDYRNRSACWECSLNGYIGKFRIWNLVLTSTQLLNDYKSEAAALGYSTTTSLSFATLPAKYRISNTITASVPRAGKVTFYERNKLIPNCKNLVAASTSATCTWKPSVHGPVSITASYSPTDPTYIGSWGSSDLVIPLRTALR